MDIAGRAWGRAKRRPMIVIARKRRYCPAACAWVEAAGPMSAMSAGSGIVFTIRSQVMRSSGPVNSNGWTPASVPDAMVQASLPCAVEATGR